MLRDYCSLGHRLNPDTGEFNTQQCGGMRCFEKVTDEYGTSLMCQARIPKRDSRICQCIVELYQMHALSFSFEILYDPKDVVEKDGILYIDASENNTITGMAIVSTPAYKESTALALIAEENGQKEQKGVESAMTLEEAIAKIAEKDQAIAEMKAQILAAEKAAEDAKKDLETKKDEEDKAQKEKQDVVASLEAANAQSAEKDAKIEELSAKVAEMEAMKAEYEAMKQEKAAAELAKQQGVAESFAASQGLDVRDETVKKAVAELDYAKIAELSMEIHKNKDNVAVASFNFAGDGMALDGGFEELLK